MPNQHRIEDELRMILSKPWYKSWFDHKNEFRKPLATKKDGSRTPTPLMTPDSVATWAASAIVNGKLLLDPIEVVEIHGYTELYRAHDGKKTLDDAANMGRKDFPLKGSAGTLGICWFERTVALPIWKASKKFEHPRAQYIDFLRSANFVRTDWNAMTDIVCMTVPQGARVPVIRGRGDWRAMKTPNRELYAPAGAPLKPRPANAPPIYRTPLDIENKLGMVALPGTVQCVVPLFNDLWVHQVPTSLEHWPFITPLKGSEL